MSLQDYFHELAEGDNALSHTNLTQLSGLASNELRSLEGEWPFIPPDRRQRLVDRLVDMAEEDVDLDFTGVLRQCLQDDNPGVRDKAVSGLWECEDRTLITPFIQLLNSDPDEHVRASAAISLGKFSALAVFGKLLPKDRDMLETILVSVAKNDKESLEVRRRALESVAVFNSDDIKALIHQEYQNLEINMRISAVYAMGRTCETEWLPAILHELDDHNPSMRYEAAVACGELGEQRAIPYLIPVLEDEDIQIQIAAIRSLAALGGNLAKRALQRCLELPDPTVQEAARDALEEIDTDDDPLNSGLGLDA